MIPLSSPDITNTERRAVMRVLRSDRLSLGPHAQDFEEKIAEYAGRTYGVAVNSGTAGLHLIVRALGIGKGDEVITTPFSFVASANAILYEGAKPVFVDIDSKTLNIDTSKIEEAITKKTKAILAVDVFGHPADWDAILRMAKKYNLAVIEDSAEAIGAAYRGMRCGSFGSASVFSFYPNKQMTTGEGGIIITNSKKIAELCRSMANQGRSVKSGEWFDHVRLGYNYRMPEMEAALGLEQFKRLPEILRKRAQVAAWYEEKLQHVSGVEIPFVGPEIVMSWFVYVVRLKNRNQVRAHLKNHGIQSTIYFKPIHLQPAYKIKPGLFPVTEAVAETTLALPFFTRMSKQQVQRVAECIKEVI
jgi:perosamine synthetase